MRFIGAAMLSAAAFLTAVLLNTNKKRHIALLLKLSDFFAAFSEYSSLSPGEAAKTAERITRGGEYSMLSFLPPFINNCRNADVREVWRNEIAAFDGFSLMSSEEKNLLLSFSEHFGLTTLEKFTDVCKKYSVGFYERYEKERLIAEENGTLTLSAGILSALLIFIVLI